MSPLSYFASSDTKAARFTCPDAKQVFSTSSNFVRVEVPDPFSEGSISNGSGGQRQLLCSMRSLLRKMGQAVLVGDYVRVSSIDWAQDKGQVCDSPRKMDWLGF